MAHKKHKSHHKSHHYHLSLPPREDKRYRKNFLSKHLKGVTEDVENLDEFAVALNPIKTIGNAGEEVSDRIKAKLRNARTPTEKRRSAIKAGIGGAALGGAIGSIAGPVAAGVGATAGGVENYLRAKTLQRRDRDMSKKSVFGGLYGEETEMGVADAIDRIAAGTNYEYARKQLLDALGEKVLQGLEVRKAQIARNSFIVNDNQEENK